MSAKQVRVYTYPFQAGGCGYVCAAVLIIRLIDTCPFSDKQTLSATPPAAGGFTHQVLTRTLTIIVWEKYYKSRWNRAVLWSDARMLGSMYRVNADNILRGFEDDFGCGDAIFHAAQTLAKHGNCQQGPPSQGQRAGHGEVCRPHLLQLLGREER